MPLFEFRCPRCEKSFETLLGKPESSHPCPQCGAEAIRVVSTFAAGATGGNCAPPGGSGFR